MANVFGFITSRTSALLRSPSSRILTQQRLAVGNNLVHSLSSASQVQWKPPTSTIRLQQPATAVAFMSYDTSNETHKQIDNLIKKSKKKVFVFMKGDPEKPLCGYSGMVVQLLNHYEVDFDSCDVLENEEIRREIKSYSDWPTIPQVYVDQNFLGGCDILLQMHQSGELKSLFEENKNESPK